MVSFPLIQKLIFNTNGYISQQTFRDEGISNYLVVYLRLLTSAQLQKKSEFFENFIEGGRTVKEFCNQVHQCVFSTAEVHVNDVFVSLGSRTHGKRE